MKIFVNNFQNPCYFRAKSKNLRDGDDIQRKASNVFPQVSSTRIEKQPYCSNSDLKTDTCALQMGKIRDMRRELAYEEKVDDWSQYENYIHTLKSLERERVGNCGEHSLAAAAALAANGYYDSSRVHLICNVQLVNKESGKVAYSGDFDLDHSFVITNMNERKEKDVVIDSWLQFADYKDGATARFKAFFADETEEAKNSARQVFYSLKTRAGEDVDLDDYETKIQFKFVSSDAGSKGTMEQLGRYARENYPQLLLNKNGQKTGGGEAL